jgi:hypothetical protein
LLSLSRKSKITLAASVAGLVLASGETVSAHPMVTGVTGFPALMLHPVLLTHQLLCLVTACLLIGRTRPVKIWQAVYGFGLGLLAAQWPRTQVPSVLTHYWIVSLVVLVVCSGVAAALPRLPAVISLPLLALLGAVIGLDTGGEGPGFANALLAVVATLLTSAIVLVPGGWLLSRPMPFWAEILVRVAAAWITAAALMVAAFALKG